MQVTTEYATTHFDDIASAADRGEEVEILRPGKPILHLVPGKSTFEMIVSTDDLRAWRTPERPRSELFNCLKGQLFVADDWDSPETNEEIARLFHDGTVFPDQA